MIMHASSQWFIAQAISSIRHGIGSRLAFEVARRGKRLVSKHRLSSDFPPQGFAFTVRSSDGLAIEDAVGCEARILAGTITSGSSSLPAKLSGSPAAIAALARRCFAAARTATV
jgi:hypothetical protein